MCQLMYYKYPHWLNKKFHTRSIWYIQGWVEWDSDKPDLVEDVSAYCRGLDQMTFKGRFQLKLFHDSVILIL